MEDDLKKWRTQVGLDDTGDLRAKSNNQEPPDRKVLEAFKDGELNRLQSAEVAFLIAHYQDWADLNSAITKERFEASLSEADNDFYVPSTEYANNLVDQSEPELKNRLFVLMGDSSDTDFRSADIDPIAPILDEIQKAICVDFDWPEKRNDPTYNDVAVLVVEIAKVLANVFEETDVPIAPIAAYLVKLGLDELCDCD